MKNKRIMNLSLQHIHIVSKDKYQLADWYVKNLGFVITDYEQAKNKMDSASIPYCFMTPETYTA